LAEARAAYTPANRAYQRTGLWLRVLDPAWAVFVSLLLLFTRLSAAFRDVAAGLGHRRYVRILVYFTLYAVTVTVLTLPLEWYGDYALEHQYGLSTQSLGSWLEDGLKSLAFTIVAAGVVPLLALAWRALERSPRRWWLWLAAGTLPVALAAVVLEPLVFDPLFNHFTPLQDRTLRADILALAARAGIPARHVYQVDVSTRTNALNAYVNGFGVSQRIVLWDTTLRALHRDEILAVMGHEMGHYVLHHIWLGLLVLGAGAFAGFGACAWITARLLRAFGPQWGVAGVGDIAALPVVVLALTLVSAAGLPFENAVSREFEHQADVYGLELTRDNDAAARAFLAFERVNRSDPEPGRWVRLLFYDHPPLGERIRFALGYRPWAHGEPDRYYQPRR
ncbi:MAG TPA: M48 family metallopeptidase, partial [Candidatus Eisenbacteria bacterium]|nr:M48 family metallopeptidase [Candidatus Eisenbacteria bacterium]